MTLDTQVNQNAYKFRTTNRRTCTMLYRDRRKAETVDILYPVLRYIVPIDSALFSLEVLFSLEAWEPWGHMPPQF